MRTTLQSVVDPEAHNFRDLRSPRLVAAGLIAWTLGGAVAAAVLWLVRIGGLATILNDEVLSVYRMVERVASPAVLFALAVSAIGAIPFAIPQPGVAKWRSACAALGCVFSGVLVWVVWRLVIMDQAGAIPYADFTRIPESRSVARLLIGAVLIVQLLCLRSTARILWRRSVQIRVGRIERQTLAGIILAVLVAAIGDGVILGAEVFADGVTASAARTLGVFLIASGSLFTTVGILSAAVDALRHGPGLVQRPLALRDLVSVEARDE